MTSLSAIYLKQLLISSCCVYVTSGILSRTCSRTTGRGRKAFINVALCKYGVLIFSSPGVVRSHMQMMSSTDRIRGPEACRQAQRLRGRGIIKNLAAQRMWKCSSGGTPQGPFQSAPLSAHPSVMKIARRLDKLGDSEEYAADTLAVMRAS